MDNGKLNILIVVDVQHDFVDGSLGTMEAQAIIPRVNDLINDKIAFDEIYYTMDTHYPDEYRFTQEGRLLPVPHCMKGSWGWTLACDIRAYPFKYEKSKHDNLLEKNQFSYIHWPMMTHYSDGRIRDFWSSDTINSITLIGLCTDICVISNALNLKAIFPEIPIICDSSACAGTTPDNHKAALAVMRSCQIKVIDNSEDKNEA